MAEDRRDGSLGEPDPGLAPRADDRADADDRAGEDERERMTISVDLPAIVHETPEDEAAVEISRVAVRPDAGAVGAHPLGTDPLGTTSIPVVARRGAHAEDAAMYTRRGRGSGSSPEPAAMLTEERLLDRKGRRPAPEGVWPALLYALTLHLVNLGDSARVRERKALDARIDRRLEGGTRFVPVLTRKGGVGKTTITTLLGMALADVREDRIIAIDANPDRGTLAERVEKQTDSTVRDLVNRAPGIRDFGQLSAHVSRDDTRLDVLASDTDPLLSEAFDEDDYNVVADLVSKYYSIALTDCGTGIVHSVMRATLRRADELVIVSGGSVDEARLASETLTWLEANGYRELVENSVVALNTGTQATNLVKLDEIEGHFRSRVREVVRIPYDPELAAGAVVRYRDLRPLTRESARVLAALVIDGLPATRD